MERWVASEQDELNSVFISINLRARQNYQFIWMPNFGQQNLGEMSPTNSEGEVD